MRPSELPATPPADPAARPSPRRAVALSVSALLLLMAVAVIPQAPNALGLTLHRFAELALLAGCALVPAGYAAAGGLAHADGRAALFVACALVGLPLLRAAAIYQLEGHTFAVLLAWGLLCLAPAALGGLTALWLLTLGLLNLSLFLLWGSPAEHGDFARPAALFGLNALWLITIWGAEALDARRSAPWLERAALALAAWFGVAAGYSALIGLALSPSPEKTGYLLATAPAALAALAVAAGAARRYLRRRDLTSLAVLATSGALALGLAPVVERWGFNFCTVPLLLLAAALVLCASALSAGRAGARLNGGRS